MRFDGCAVYMLTNENRAVLYVGVTSDLVTRVAQHRAGVSPSSFTARYRVDRLVYFECHGDMCSAIAREKQIKAWARAKKVALIEHENEKWSDLWYRIAR